MEDIFEAFIGAIYMDFNEELLESPQVSFPLSGIGYYMAEKWIVSIIESHLDFAELICHKTNYKDMLMRFMQHTFQMAPQFYEMSVEMHKPANSRFRYCVKDRNGSVLGTAYGSSKKDAENNAAKAALDYYGQSVNSM
jgi:dsRNA-specific ribonuclease